MCSPSSTGKKDDFDDGSDDGFSGGMIMDVPASSTNTLRTDHSYATPL